MEEPPEPPEMYNAFANALLSTDQGALLDADEGLAGQWAQVIADRLDKLEDSTLEDELVLEANTWRLVQLLYGARLDDIDRTACASTSKNPYVSPESLMSRIVNSSQDLSELQAICQWTETVATANPTDNRRGYQPYTRSKLKQHARTGGKLSAQLVTQLDPDATLRADGARLADEDETYETAFLRTLFEYVRAGQWESAIDMCRQSDQSWRAASLAGALAFHDGHAGSEDMDDDEEPPLKRRKGNHGNSQLRLWRQMSRKIAQNTSIKLYERALYGVLSGEIEAVLPACESWEDQLWAYSQVLLANELERRTADSEDGQFWLEGHRETERKTAIDIKQALNDAFERMQESQSRGVRAAATHPLRIAQRFLVLGQIDRLFDEFSANLEEQVAGLSEPEAARRVRFFAHLALYLRKLGQTLPSSVFGILEAYTRVLEKHNMNDLLAYYAAQLDDEEAVETYAAVLQRTHPALPSREARFEQLEKAAEHGLELADVARRTVEKILAEALANPVQAQPGSLFQANKDVSDLESELIKSIEWLTFHEETFVDALRQSNALTRFFLASGKSHAARELLASLPSEIPTYVAAHSTGDRDPLVSLHTEYTDYITLFQCLSAHTRYTDAWAKRPTKKTSRAGAAPFAEALKGETSVLYDVVLSLLEGRWLNRQQVFGGLDDDNAEGRLHELSVVRHIYIPELIFRLHRVLYETRVYIPANLQLAIDLVQIIANDNHGLWEEFISEDGHNRLSDLLDRVREVSLAALDANGSPFVVSGPVG